MGLDAGLDHRAPDFVERLKVEAGDGVDLFFDNVGGPLRAALLDRMNTFGRIVVCGMIAEYNDDETSGPGWLPILTRQLTVRGFLVNAFDHLRDDFLRDASAWIEQGRLVIREDITDGLENTPGTFIRMLQGQTFGKAIIRL